MADEDLLMAEAIRLLQAAAGQGAGAGDAGAAGSHGGGVVAEVARVLGLGEDHLRRRFTQAVGVSPQRFRQALSWELARERLAASTGVLAAALDAGLSGPGRLHDLAVQLVAATPGEVASGGASLTFGYGFAATPLGGALLGWTPRGLATLRFVEPGTERAELAGWQAEWPRARFREDAEGAADWVRRVFAHWRGEVRGPLALHVRGTAFQLQVWRALLAVPEGALVTYSEVAGAVGRPQAVRAAASAIGANPVSVLIPCHRVLRLGGGIGGYRWGLDRKRGLLAAELARTRRAG